ncbi:hypothetical protein Q5P01_016772 [Channa striata]|uniref:Uncharacterized protein n=1 Tax=Channa striata TaxID=64152 RepID=A0AA88SIA1_CHASR|nr:hypothetical protein Q5P01_016772 [Channa striata]
MASGVDEELIRLSCGTSDKTRLATTALKREERMLGCRDSPLILHPTTASTTPSYPQPAPTPQQGLAFTQSLTGLAGGYRSRETAPLGSRQPVKGARAGRRTAYSTPGATAPNRFVGIGSRDNNFLNIPQQTQSWFL